MIVSRKDSFRNAFNNSSDHLADIEDAPDLPSLEIEKLSLFQQLERVKKEMKDAPDVLSLAVRINSNCSISRKTVRTTAQSIAPM